LYRAVEPLDRVVGRGAIGVGERTLIGAGTGERNYQMGNQKKGGIQSGGWRDVKRGGISFHVVSADKKSLNLRVGRVMSKRIEQGRPVKKERRTSRPGDMIVLISGGLTGLEGL